MPGNRKRDGNLRTGFTRTIDEQPTPAFLTGQAHTGQPELRKHAAGCQQQHKNNGLQNAKRERKCGPYLPQVVADEHHRITQHRARRLQHGVAAKVAKNRTVQAKRPKDQHSK